MSKKLYMSLIFSNLVVFKTLSSNHRMYNLYTKFVKTLEICKQFSENLVNESGNVPRRGPVPKFSDLEVVALSLTAETIDKLIANHELTVAWQERSKSHHASSIS